MKHFVLTRFNWDGYEGDFFRKDNPLLLHSNLSPEEWLEHRYKLFRETRESVLSQDSDFEWIISFDKNTSKDYIDLCINGSDKITPIFCDIREFKYHDWCITSRMDNDDFYLDGALGAIQKAAQKKKMVVDIEYYQYFNGTYFTSERRAANSPFLSLVAPPNFESNCYSRPHTIMNTIYPAMKVKQPYAVMVVHGKNVANKIVGKQVKL